MSTRDIKTEQNSIISIKHMGHNDKTQIGILKRAKLEVSKLEEQQHYGLRINQEDLQIHILTHLNDVLEIRPKEYIELMLKQEYYPTVKNMTGIIIVNSQVQRYVQKRVFRVMIKYFGTSFQTYFGRVFRSNLKSIYGKDWRNIFIRIRELTYKSIGKVDIEQPNV